MGGIGAFIQGFASTTMEMQKRAQEERQFKMQLEMQKTQLEMQREQFNAQLQLREAERQDALKQHKFENQIATFREKREAANTQNLMEERGLKREQSAAEEKAKLQQKYDLARNDKAMKDLLERKMAFEQEGASPEDIAKIDKAIQDRRTELRGQLGAAPPEWDQVGGQPLSGQPAPPPQAAPGQDQTAQAAPGQAPLPPATQMSSQPAAAPQAPPQQSGQAGPPMGLGSVAARYRLPTQAEQKPPEAKDGFQEREFETQAEAERRGARFKQFDMPFFATSKEGKIKAEREKQENLLKTYKAEASLAETQMGEMADAFRQAGADVEIDVDQEGTKTSSRRLGGHFGGMVLGSGLSFGGTEGQAMKTLAKVDLFPKTRQDSSFWSTYGANEPITPGVDSAEDRSLGTTLKLGDVLYDKAVTRGEKVSQVWVGAVQDVMRDRVADTLGPYGDKPSFEVSSFGSVLDPKRNEAAKAAVALASEDQKLAAVSEKNNVPYAGTRIPQVVDRTETPADVLRNFEKATQKIGKPLPNMEPHRAEQAVISELQTRMQGVNLDGPAKKEATRILNGMMKDPNVSDQFKARAKQVFDSLITVPEKKGGPTAALEGLSRMGAPVASAENVKAANKAFNSVTQKTKDKAADAVSTVNTEYSQMTDKEKKGAQSTWKAKRANWKTMGIKESVLRDMNAAVGLARNDGLTA